MVKIGRTSSKGLRLAVFWLVVCLAVALDQATKAAVRVVVPSGTRPLIPGLIELMHVENTGAAFSLGRGAGIVFVVIAAVVLVVAMLLVQRTEDLPLFLVASLGCVAGGGVGNMIDRIMKGSVTDFLATTFINFPVFNVADIFVTVGVAITVVGFLAWDAKHGREQNKVDAR